MDNAQSFTPRSSSSALMTAISTFVFPHPQPVATATFQHVLGLLGYEANTTRQALIRTGKEGMLESERRGRHTYWQLSPSGHAFISQSRQRIRTLTRSHAPWDGHFVIVIAPVPEADRASRRLLRTQLMWAGFGSPHPGMWISPHRSAEQDAAHVIAELGLEDSVSFIARLGMTGDSRDLVRRAWDLTKLDERYRAFIARFRDSRPRQGDELVRELTLLIHGWRRFPFYDPALPRDLLPVGWSGQEAAELFEAHRAMWDRPAIQHFQDLVDRQVTGVK